ncbi:MAG: Wzt carbohydrate-binding domain-containing protein, partial [Kiritimatiellia bacterium]|nr:Wzt carbohydrate-binding domain-containing protein [Kiritimatiellia bacterium]
EKGRLVAEAEPKKAVDAYKQIMVGCASGDAGVSAQSGADTLSYGNKKAQIMDCGIYAEPGRPTRLLENGKPFTIRMKVKFENDIAEPIFAFTIKDLKGLEVTGTNTEFKKQVPGSFRKGDTVEVKYEQILNMQSGKYALSLGCVGNDKSGLVVYHRLYDAVFFEVSSSLPMVGLYDLGSRITVRLCG